MGSITIGNNVVQIGVVGPQGETGDGSSLPAPVAFSVVVDLTANKYMPQQAVSAVIAFTPATSPVAGGSNYVRLTADGVNMPTFTGFKEWGGSLGYSNIASQLNIIQFWSDGTDEFFSVTQPVTVAAPTVPGLMAAPVGTAGDAQVSWAFTTPTSGGSTIIGYTITTSDGKTGTGTSSPIVTTGHTNGTAITATAKATNAIGTGTASPASQSVTPSAAVAVARLTSLSSDMTEGGTSPNYTYTCSGASFSTNFGGVANLALQTGVDGSLAATYVSSAGESLFGLQSGTTPLNYTVLPISLYGSINNGYLPLTNGTQGTATNQMWPQTGDVIRLRRTGTSVLGEVSKDGGSTWTTAYTWTGVSASLTHFQVGIGNAAGTLTTLTAVGLA